VQLLLEHLDPPPAERATWLGLLLTIINHAEERDIANYANRNYYWHYNSSRVPDWLKQADAETDEARRRELYRKVQQQLADDAANLWVYAPNQLQVLRRGLENVQVQGIAPSLYLVNASSSCRWHRARIGSHGPDWYRVWPTIGQCGASSPVPKRFQLLDPSVFDTPIPFTTRCERTRLSIGIGASSGGF
jgi:hypothetical protein